MSFLLRWIVTTIAVSLALYLVPGIHVPTEQDAWISIVIFSMFLAVINTSIKPLLHTLSLPISFLTLGIFALAINTAMIYLAAWLANTLFLTNFSIDSFGSAFLASIVISIASAIISRITGLNDEIV